MKVLGFLVAWPWAIHFIDRIMKITVLKNILLVTLTLVFEGCVTYYKAPISLEEAVASQSKVKIVTEDHTEYRFDQLLLEEGTVYGLKPLQEGKKEPLAPYIKEIDEEKKQIKILFPFPITEIYPKNQTKTDVINGAIIATPIISLIIYWILEDSKNEGMSVSPI